MVARDLVRENQERFTPWDECAIIVRSVSDYSALLSGVLTRYGVPFAFRRGRPILENAAVRSLANLLRIFVGGWQREDVIAFIRCEQVSPLGVGFDFLRVKARSAGARQGRHEWERLYRTLQREAEQEQVSESSATEALRRLLELGAAAPTGPATFDDHAEFIRSAIDTFNLDRAEGGANSDREDRAAMKQAVDAVDDIQRHARLTGLEPVTFAQFHHRLVASWRTLSFMPIEPERAVSIIEPYDAQQLRPRVVYVMGLTERVFPRRVMDDPFFRDDEREVLRESAGIHLELQRDRADDERLLFYMAVTAPIERLVLSFPRSSEESDSLPSFFLDEVRSALDAAGERLPAVVRTLADVAPSIEECANDRDRLLAACSVLGDSAAVSAELPDDIRAVVETRGHPPAPTLSAESTAAFGAARRYSVTEIEEYHRCPFQHFAKYGLKLRLEADGAGPKDRGALHHDTLRRTLRAMAASGETPDRRRLLDAFVREMADCLNERTVDARPHRRELMERAVRGALEVCAEREERYRDLFNMTPAHFELAFGMEDTTDEDGRSRDYDPASSPHPLVIAGDDGEPIHLCGAIDRMDLAADCRTAMVLDYKMGGTKEWAEIKEGKSIQIPLYLMAVEQVWQMVGAVGCYDSPRDNGRRRFYRRELVDVRAFQPLPGVEDGRLAKPVAGEEYQGAVTAAKRTVIDAAAGIRSGRISPTPGEHCRWCDFVDVCRTSPDGEHDGESLQ